MKSSKRKSVTLVLVVVLTMVGLYAQSPKAKALKEYAVGVSPSTAGKVAEYKFHVELEKKIGVHERFHLYFPKGTSFIPPLPTEKSELKRRLTTIIEAVHFSVPNSYCPSCSGLPMIVPQDDGSILIIIGTPTSFDPADEKCQNFTITITKEAGIANPSIPGFYQYGIRNSQEPEYVNSKIVEICSDNQNNSFCWLSNPFVSEYTSLSLKIPLYILTFESFELTLHPKKQLYMGPFLTSSEPDLDLLKRTILFQNKPLDFYGDAFHIQFINNTIMFQYTPKQSQSFTEGLNFLLPDTLLLEPVQEGTFQLTGRVKVFFDNQSDVLTEELSLQFNEMYIFSN